MANHQASVVSSVGTLSAGDVVTNASGNGSVTFTAPDAEHGGNAAMISGCPVRHETAGNAGPRTLSIAFIGLPECERTFICTATFAVIPVVTLRPDVNEIRRNRKSSTPQAGWSPACSTKNSRACKRAAYSLPTSGAMAPPPQASSSATRIPWAEPTTVTLIVTDARGTDAVAAFTLHVHVNGRAHGDSQCLAGFAAGRSARRLRRRRRRR